ncbi:MAG: DHH family phosphoesterase [Planctomycetes bacterium]|nr:DHH family phosphoesterase [Planctomycetota bacterium]
MTVEVDHSGVDVIPAEVAAALEAASRILLVGHVTPDADCLGSMGAFKAALEARGKVCFASLPAGSVNRRLAFLTEMVAMTPATDAEMKNCDLILAVDTAKARRVNLDGKLDAYPDVPVLNIDHHATNVGYGSANWVDGERSSTAEMVYEVLRSLDCEITPTVATQLYAGLHTDTHGFSLPNTTERSLRVAAELAGSDIDIADLCERLHRSQSRGEFDLLRVFYDNTRVTDDGHLAWSTADYDEIHDAGCSAEDIDDQVNVPRSIEGITVAILFTEGVKGKIRMNFRGERGVGILELAQSFAGGGHRAAAGAILDGTIEEVSQRVLAEAREFINKQLAE